MKVRDWTKLIIAAMVLVAVSILTGMDKVESEAAIAVISAVLGYVFGNSHGLLENRGKKQ